MALVTEENLGFAAGLLTSVLWTGTALCFTAAGRRIGATAVNASRIGFAIVLLAITHRLISGTWFPALLPRQTVYLALSGLFGLAIGDQFLFSSYLHIGPRIAMLIMATGPIFAAGFGWIALGETLPARAWVGVAMTVGGVAWVVLERRDGGHGVAGGSRARGLLYAIGATICQTGGMLLSKAGMGHGWLPHDAHLAPQAATLSRMLFAGISMLPILAYAWWRTRQRRRRGETLPRAGSRRAGFLLAGCGACVGPFLGVWMSLVAADRAPLGIAVTLCSLPPVLILPFAAKLHKERIGPRAVLGAMLAVAGTAFLYGTTPAGPPAGAPPSPR